MSLHRLDIVDFRCIASSQMEFDPRLNILSGANASGKTSLMEAVYFLGRGRSFRTSQNETLIRQGAQELRLSGSLSGSGSAWRPLGVCYRRDGFEARASGSRIGSLADLATIFPVQAIDPEVHRLVDGGPQERRRYLDWGVFHVEPRFVEQWRRFQRALKQRNAALRTGMAEEVARAWDNELVESGVHLANSRRQYLVRLGPFVRRAGEQLLGLPVDLSLHEGWAAELSLADALERAWPRDRERGSTGVGPHRADVAIRVSGAPARHRISRGQQKLTACALLLGQVLCGHDAGSPTVALLVDDPAAELDSAHLERLLSLVLDLPGQLFMTALDPNVRGLSGLPEGRRFHVEHGEIARLV